MRRVILPVIALTFLGIATDANAVPIVFDSDPFEGSTAPTTPGRQVVGEEEFLANFDFASDRFIFDSDFFAVTGIDFVNDEIGNVPATGVNTIVLRTFDNDNDPITAFNAGIAANLIAERVTEAGAGFFVYFNSGLNMPRLVYSTDLSDDTADLKVLARFESLFDDRAAMAFFTEGNFAVAQVPEPTTLALLVLGGAWSASRYARRRRV